MFCANCGQELPENVKFCMNCGNKIGEAGKDVAASVSPTQKKSGINEVTLWEGKPSHFMDKAKGKVDERLNSTTYIVTNQRILARTGIIGTVETEVDLKHIKDIAVKQSLTDKIAKVGDIFIVSSDLIDGNFKLESIAEPFQVKEIIRKAVVDYRANMNIIYREGI